jgi:cytochrome c oxidase subunit 2
MEADVRVVSRSEFDTWAEERANIPAYADMTQAERGEIWFNEFACSGCHNITGDPGGAGPTWKGIYGREELLTDGSTVIVDHIYIYQSILEPNSQIVDGFNEGIMPQDYGTRIDERQAEILANEGIEIDIIDDLISFMQTLE